MAQGRSQFPLHSRLANVDFCSAGHARMLNEDPASPEAAATPGECFRPQCPPCLCREPEKHLPSADLVPLLAEVAVNSPRAADTSRVPALATSMMDEPPDSSLPRYTGELDSADIPSPPKDAPELTLGPFQNCPGPVSYSVPLVELDPPLANLEHPECSPLAECPVLGSLLAIDLAVEPHAPQTERHWELQGSSFAPFPVRQLGCLADPMPPPLTEFDWLVDSRPSSRAAAGFKIALPRLRVAHILLLLVAIPVLVAIAFLVRGHRSIVPGTTNENLPARAEPGWFSSKLPEIQQAVSERAGIRLFEDFRSGIDDWVDRGEAKGSWIFDETGFVQPRRLALYRPSLGMSNYKMEFLGEVDKKALSWVFRARDFRNYHAAKLMIALPGPLPKLVLRHYAVIGGLEMPQKEIVLPLTIRGNPLFQVRTEARGSGFSVSIGDRLVAHWTDSRLPLGGIGFFSSRGENSRIRWVRIEHQYDVLGRICAYLTPAQPVRTATMGVGNASQP